MAMKFAVEQKGQMFLVVNQTTGVVKARLKDKGEADVLAKRYQDQHNEGIEMASARLTEQPKVQAEE